MIVAQIVPRNAANFLHVSPAVVIRAIDHVFGCLRVRCVVNLHHASNTKVLFGVNEYVDQSCPPFEAMKGAAPQDDTGSPGREFQKHPVLGRDQIIV
jgi:hypothetical protein